MMLLRYYYSNRYSDGSNPSHHLCSGGYDDGGAAFECWDMTLFTEWCDCLICSMQIWANICCMAHHHLESCRVCWNTSFLRVPKQWPSVKFSLLVSSKDALFQYRFSVTLSHSKCVVGQSWWWYWLCNYHQCYNVLLTVMMTSWSNRLIGRYLMINNPQN